MHDRYRAVVESRPKTTAQSSQIAFDALFLIHYQPNQNG